MWNTGGYGIIPHCRFWVSIASVSGIMSKGGVIVRHILCIKGPTCVGFGESGTNSFGVFDEFLRAVHDTCFLDY